MPPSTRKKSSMLHLQDSYQVLISRCDPFPQLLLITSNDWTKGCQRTIGTSSLTERSIGYWWIQRRSQEGDRNSNYSFASNRSFLQSRRIELRKAHWVPLERTKSTYCAPLVLTAHQCSTKRALARGVSTVTHPVINPVRAEHNFWEWKGTVNFPQAVPRKW